MVVLDSSVIIKWFVEEKDSEKALIWRDSHIGGQEIILVPSLFFYEIANVLRYKTNLPTEEILEVVRELENLNLKIEEANSELIMKSVVFARTTDISVYDAVFIILAKLYKTEFITADTKLFQKIKHLEFAVLL